MLPIPETFIQMQIELNGAVGHAWVERLPAIVDSCARRWNLTIEPSSAPLSYNYVVPARRADGTAVIVKACAPAGEFAVQAAALRIYDGHGAVRLLELDRDDEVMLLERCEPGTPLLAVEDEERATSIAAATMRQLWRPVPLDLPLDLLPDHPFPSVADWAKGLERLRARFDGGTGPFPTALVEQAEGLFTALIASMDEPVVLHGDLNYGNVLAAQRQPWLAIDPKGVVGEPAYETGVLLRDPLPRLLNAPYPGRILARRVDQLAAELGFERARIRGWGVAQAVLSAWWSFEDHGHGWEPAIACAELLAAIKV